MSESFDRALRWAARRGRPAGVCPNAALLAAFADNGLTPDERRLVETHAADCPTCQQHLALLGAVSLDRDAPEPSRSWLVRWGWLVPVATAVLVVAVWVRLPEQKAAPDAPTALEASRAELPLRNSERLASPSIEQPAATTTPRAEYDLAKKAPPPVANNVAQSARDARTLSAKAKSDELAPLERRDAFSQTAENAPPAVAAPPAAPVAREQEAGQEKVQGQRVGAASKVATPQAAAAPALSDAMKEEAMAESVAPRETYRARGNRIEQSRDGGTTWSSVLSEPQSTFTVVGCAPNGPCWIGTADGQVLRRTPDGFARSVLPVRARVGAIAAESALSVVVTVEGGQRFRTTDGGITWNPVP